VKFGAVSIPHAYLNVQGKKRKFDRFLITLPINHGQPHREMHRSY
jgi:hypothetical protein